MAKRIPDPDEIRGAVAYVCTALQAQIEHAMADRMIEAGRVTEMVDILFAGPTPQTDPNAKKEPLSKEQQDANYARAVEALPEDALNIPIPLSKVFPPNLHSTELRLQVLDVLNIALEKNGFDTRSPNPGKLKARIAKDRDDVKITSSNMRTFMQKLPSVLAQAQEYAMDNDKNTPAKKTDFGNHPW